MTFTEREKEALEGIQVGQQFDQPFNRPVLASLVRKGLIARSSTGFYKLLKPPPWRK